VQPRLAQSTCALTNWILVFVGINASIDHVIKQVVHDVCQTLGVQHPMKSSDKHRLLRFQTMRRLTNVVTVTQHPRDYLYLHTRCANNYTPTGLPAPMYMVCQ